MTRDLPAKKLLRLLGLGFLFLVIIVYGIWKGRDLIFGINLKISGITNNETTTNANINLVGNAYHAVDINVDGRVVPIEQDGSWHDEIALLKGYNIISISAKDRFGRIITKTFSVTYKPPQDNSIQIIPTPTTSATNTVKTTTSTENNLQ